MPRTNDRKSEAEAVEGVRETLSRAKLRSTAARIAVMRHLQDVTSPVTHAEVADALVPVGYDKATVFRNLTDLVEAGLVMRTELGDHVWRFELMDPDHPHRSQHAHFVCVSCGSVSCLHDLQGLSPERLKAQGVGEVTEILLKGHCSSCT